MAKQVVYVPYGEQPPKQRTRIFTWVILAINVLFLIWIIVGVASNSGDASNCGGLSQQDCNNANDAGTAIGVGVIVLFWALVDVILGVIWLVTRRSQQIVFLPPQQGGGIPQQQGGGMPPQTASPAPPAGWFPDPQNASQLRWWDGQRYTEHTQPAQR